MVGGFRCQRMRRPDGFTRSSNQEKVPYWLVCAMPVEKPARITHLVAQWFRERLLSEAIFWSQSADGTRYAEVEHNFSGAERVAS